ncbi:MAG: Ig-like domain-containing protein [Lachnospiraceae bacterium]|nr:Ig-like domain-containing protein [Lachnospiraceae bacterium]
MKKRMLVKILSAALSFSMLAGETLPAFAWELEEDPGEQPGEEVSDNDVESRVEPVLPVSFDDLVSAINGDGEGEDAVSDNDITTPALTVEPEYDPYDPDGDGIISAEEGAPFEITVNPSITDGLEKYQDFDIPTEDEFYDYFNDTVDAEFKELGTVSVTAQNNFYSSCFNDITIPYTDYDKNETYDVPAAYPAAYTLPAEMTDDDPLKVYLETNYPPCYCQGTKGICWAEAFYGMMKINAIKRGIDLTEDRMVEDRSEWSWEPENLNDVHETACYFWEGSGENNADPSGDLTAHEKDTTHSGGNMQDFYNPFLNRLTCYSKYDNEYGWIEIYPETMKLFTISPEKNHNQTQKKYQSFIKKVIQETGSVYINLQCDKYNKNYNTYLYDPSKGMDDSDHAILIVGWDDSIPKEYFADKNGNAPESDGGWLIRNSWNYDRKTFSHQSYAWISYEHTSLWIIGALNTIDESDGHPGKRFSYMNEGRENGNATYPYATAYANIFRDAMHASGSRSFDAGDHTVLRSITFDSTHPTDYNLEIYTHVDPEKGPTSGILKQKLSGTVHLPGSTTLYLKDPVYVKNSEYFSIVIYANSLYAIGLEGSDEYSRAQKGQSFVYNGKEWLDTTTLTSHYGNVNIFCTGDNAYDWDLPVEKVQDPTITARNADTLQIGDTIELTCGQSTADIYYSYDNAEFTKYETPIMIKKKDAGKEFTLYLYASEEGFENSNTVSHAWTVSDNSMVNVSIREVQLTTANRTFEVYATVWDVDGQLMEKPVVAWKNDNEKVVGLTQKNDVNGEWIAFVEALDDGTANITAEYTFENGVTKSDSCKFEVVLDHPERERHLTVEPSYIGFIKKNDTVQLNPTVKDGNGIVLTGMVVTYASSDETVATVTESGLVTSISNGNATITAECEGSIVEIPVTVDAKLISCKVDFYVKGSLYYSTKVEKGTALNTLPEDPEGEFLGWFESGSKTAWDSTGIIEKNLTLYAKFESDGSRSAFDPEPDTEEMEMFLVKGQSFTLTPASGWTTSNKSVVAVSKKGVVSAKKAGTATLNGNGITYNVRVATPELSSKSITMIAGENKSISISILVQGVNCSENYPVYWSSNNLAVATVYDGNIYAMAKGNATITATVNGKSYNCKVKVNDTDKVKVTKRMDSLTMSPMQNITLKLSGYKFKNLTWTSTREMKVYQNGKKTDYADDVVYITADGKLTAIGVGTTTVKGSNGVELTITVNAPINKSLYLTSGKSKAISYTGVTSKNAKWRVENVSGTAVRVDGAGKVTTSGTGVANVICEYNPCNVDNAGFTYITTVYVEKPYLLAEGLTHRSDYAYEAFMSPNEETNIINDDGYYGMIYQQLIYKSSKPNVAFVDENGVLHARSTGKTKITTKLNGKTITITVTVR